MALQGISFSLSQSRISSNDPHCHGSITPSASSAQYCQLKTSPSPCAIMKISSKANPKSCFRQSESLQTVRRRRRGLSFTSFPSPAQAVKALRREGGNPRRLVDVVRSIPKISRAYFKNPFRRALYGGISLLGGFYVAQTISLSFGALGVNDVIAAALCVLFAEYVTKFYHTRRRVNFATALVNNFKMGFTYGLFIDAFKLAS